MIVQALANGFVQGLWLAVLALSFALVYHPTAIFFPALAGVYAAVPFVSQALQNMGFGSAVASALAVLTGALLSLACQWLNHEQLIRKNASPGVHMVSSLGIYIVIHQAISIIWGSDTRTLLRHWDSRFFLGPIQLSPAQTATSGSAFLALVAAYMFLRRSDIGLRLRAHADDPSELGLLGYSLPRLRTMCFGLSGLLCGEVYTSCKDDCRQSSNQSYRLGPAFLTGRLLNNRHARNPGDRGEVGCRRPFGPAAGMATISAALSQITPRRASAAAGASPPTGV